MFCDIKLIFILISLLFVSPVYSNEGQFSIEKRLQYKNRVKQMFYHAYDSYLKYAYPYDELRPLTCDGYDTWGSYSLSLVDAIDTLATLGNSTEFARVYTLIQNLDLERDINVSVFETNIRVIGGLLSAHLLAKRMNVPVNATWPCTGPLLDIAVALAKKLLPAFDTATGIPYGTINLVWGVPSGETNITCTAGGGTFLIEFGTLSRLTGDPLYERVALRALQSIWSKRSSIDLVKEKEATN
jgi:mannosidase alpha-like ER degradation enhancer 2